MPYCKALSWKSKKNPLHIGGQASAEQYQISVYVKMAFYDTREKQTLWEIDRMRGYGIYDAASQRASHARKASATRCECSPKT